LNSFANGWCESKLNVSPALWQQHGFVHAGVLMTLADHTCGGAAASTVPGDKDVITVENKVSFLRPASSSVLISRADVLKGGKNLVFVEAEVMGSVTFTLPFAVLIVFMIRLYSSMNYGWF
jgi:uncharacterized protein (TIGR00369 family)